MLLLYSSMRPSLPVGRGVESKNIQFDVVALLLFFFHACFSFFSIVHTRHEEGDCRIKKVDHLPSELTYD